MTKSRILEILENKARLYESDDEAPEETDDMDLGDDMGDDTSDNDTTDTDTDANTDDGDVDMVDGAEEANAADGSTTDDTENDTEDTDDTKTDNTENEDTQKKVDSSDTENLDKSIEQMIGITDIEHTSSSSVIDFEDGGQVIYVQPYVTMSNETINELVDIIVKSVTKVYGNTQDEISGKKLKETKYWKSIRTMVETMVKSQLTKSANFDGLIEEVKALFKVLEVK